MASVAALLLEVIEHLPGLSADARDGYRAAVDAEELLHTDHAAPVQEPVQEHVQAGATSPAPDTTATSGW